MSSPRLHPEWANPPHPERPPTRLQRLLIRAIDRLRRKKTGCLECDEWLRRHE
jgi:hypothetical protein